MAGSFDGWDDHPASKRVEGSLAALPLHGAFSEALSLNDEEDLEEVLRAAEGTALLVHGTADTSAMLGALLAALRQSPGRRRQILLGITEVALRDPALRGL